MYLLQHFASAKCDITTFDDAKVTIKPVLESICIVQHHIINILIKFSFIYYFFNRAKSKMHDWGRLFFTFEMITKR